MQRLLVLGAMLSLTMPIQVYNNRMEHDCMAPFDQATDWASSWGACSGPYCHFLERMLSCLVPSLFLFCFV